MNCGFTLQSDASDIPYPGDLSAFDLLHIWAVDKCVPLVREITFENAEVSTARYNKCIQPGVNTKWKKSSFAKVV